MKKIICILSASVMLLAKPAYAVSINSDVGLTPAKDQTIVRVQSRYKKVSDDPTTLDRETKTLVVPVTVVYGFTERLAGIVSVPWIYRRHKTLSGTEKITRKIEGLGDISLLGKYRIYTRDEVGVTSRLSVISGFELPTGRTGDEDAHGKLPRTLQAGSGAVDGILGLAFTHQTLDDEWDTNLTYQWNNEANDFEFGDVFKYTLAYQKGVLPWVLPEEGMYQQLNLVLELNGEWQQKHEDQSGTVADSGGHTIYVSPGLQMASKRWVAEASIQLPVYQDLNGSQVETDYTVVASLRFTF